MTHRIEESLAEGDRPDFYSDWWRHRVTALRRFLDAIPPDTLPADFLTHPAFAACGIITNDTDAAVAQDAEMRASGYTVNVGGGLPAEASTPITHAYHLWRAGLPNAHTPDAGAVMEWGGGYGSMARLTRRFPNAPTHIIVDSPIMCTVQEAYLRRFNIGATAWNRYWPGVTPFLDGGVWLTAPGNAHLIAPSVGGVHTFIATYSLDECAAAAHDYVIDHDWFGASRVLVAAQKIGKEGMFPDGPSLYRRLVDAGFAEFPTHYAGSVYLEWERP